MGRTLFLWDLADTLFLERWDGQKSGFASYDAYVVSLGYDLKIISPRDYEWAYERPYREELFDLKIAVGFKEVLTWTKNNGVFTTGNKEQIDWRAEQLLKKYGFDIRDYLKEVYSTFDHGNTNLKTTDMYRDILKKKYAEGFDIIVYTDNDLKNCQMFIRAFQELPPPPSLIKEGERRGSSHRVYHILNDNRELRPRDGYWEIGNLYDMMENEKALDSRRSLPSWRRGRE